MNSPESMGGASEKQVRYSELPRTASSLLGEVLRESNFTKGVGSAVDVGGRVASARPVDAPNTLSAFLAADTPSEALKLWFGLDRLRESRVRDPHWIVEQLDRDIAKIDALMERQINEVIHCKAFQRLEASWRGIEYLVERRDEYSEARIAVQVLSVGWNELKRDFEGAVEFDQSDFFRKVYEERLGLAGSEPFSVLIADYYIHPRSSRQHPFDDISILRGLTQVAAAAFCPLITNADPSMFAVDQYQDLRSSVDLGSLHSSLDFIAWQRFRELEDSRFVSLALPQMLMRRPYRDDHEFGFPFTETISSQADCLWGGAAWGMGEVLMRAFADSGWFAGIRGAKRGEESGGLVLGPASDPFGTEPSEYAPRSITNFVVSDVFEKELANAGFLPLCACKDMPLAAFHSATSAQKPRAYNTVDATMSARLSSMLNYMLCVSRFAHYLKWIARDQIGVCNTPDELQNLLMKWIIDYVSPDASASASTRLRKPLLDAEIKVIAIPGRAGEYQSIFHLVPHHELDDMRVSIRLDTKLLPRR